MIDAEVPRLRRLRNTALRVRAIAAVMDSYPARRNSLFSRSAVSCWRIARVITGRLRAQPYPRHHRGPSDVPAAYDRVSVALLGAIARFRGRTLQTFLGELQRLVRELDDVRALTWSADLSDTFGRSQKQIRGLIRELALGARTEPGPHIDIDTRVDARSAAVRDDAGSVAGNWPYLAF